MGKNRVEKIPVQKLQVKERRRQNRKLISNVF